MAGSGQRSRWHSLTGLAALILFAIFWGNIALAKIAMFSSFAPPRLSAREEFVTLFVATLLGITFLLEEERRKARL